MRTTLPTTLRGSICCAIKRNVIFQHEVENRQHLMCYRDYGPLLAASRNASRNRVWNMHPVFRVADHAHCTRVVRRYELPCVVWLPFFIPALSRLPGHNPAQLAVFSAVGNVVKSTPVSAKMLAAASWPTPG